MSEASEPGAAFRGPTEHREGRRCEHHFANVYETDAERFAAAVPFVRRGLDRGERVVYVTDEDSEAAVRSALRDGGIDVRAALKPGALSFYTVRDTSVRNSSFDPTEMVERDEVTDGTATEEDESLRIVAETTWLPADATVEQVVEYEARVGDLLANEDWRPISARPSPSRAVGTGRSSSCRRSPATRTSRRPSVRSST
ncbi:MEDS domain-containing protein [Halorussus sp. MSC15.2]|uniref:MEDS domain-containing protein n=1 Tax=Halorussus sp. MSC15.2 TaxID=2283638 RepID=UPI0013D44C98|nr:MEDS domain-containing protein [Halorussus sp. MSC15.2]NEU58314.1 hypothetical protein [Halorussus sp. MSC15.2]